MKLLVCVLQKTELLEQLLNKLECAGIKGATVLQSKGIAVTLLDSKKDIPFLGHLRSVLDPEREENCTIFIVLDEEKLSIAIKTIEETIGDLNKPNTGIIFTTPVDFAKGIR